MEVSLFGRATGMSSLTLRFFDRSLEEEFLDAYFSVTLKRIRFGLIVGAVLYAVFGVLDRWIIPEALAEAYIIRYALMLPYLALFFLFTYSAAFRKVGQHVIAFTGWLAGAGIVFMITFAGVPGKHLYYSGLILVIMMAYTFVNLRFIYAVSTSWLLVAMHGIVTFRFDDVTFPIFLNNNFFFISANIIGMFAGYMMEISARKNFLQLKVIESNMGLLENEIGKRKRIEDQLRTISITDELTGLYNRRGFFSLAEPLLVSARKEGKRICLLYADLNDLKTINDTFGHCEGDAALVEIAGILRRCCSPDDLIARLGGDEFVVLFVERRDHQRKEINAALHALLEEHSRKNNGTYRLAATIGISCTDAISVSTVDDLIAIADQRMYEGKRGRGNTENRRSLPARRRRRED